MYSFYFKINISKDEFEYMKGMNGIIIKKIELLFCNLKKVYIKLFVHAFFLIVIQISYLFGT